MTFKRLLSLLLLAAPLALAQPAADPGLDGLDRVDGELTVRDARSRYTAWFDGEQLRRVRDEVVLGDRGRAVDEYELAHGSLTRYRRSGMAKRAGVGEAGQDELRVEIDFDDRGRAQRIEHLVGGIPAPLGDDAVRDVGTRLATLHNAAYHLRAARRGSAAGRWEGNDRVLEIAADGALQWQGAQSSSPVSGRWNLDGGDRLRMALSGGAAPAVTVWRMQGETLLAVEGELPLKRVTGGPGLAGTAWNWRGMITPVERIEPREPALYGIEFGPDARLSVRADCNRASGRFDAGGGRIAFGPMPATMAECPSGSLSNRFLRDLGRAVIYRVDGDRLYMELPYDSGVMEFARRR